MACMSVGSFFFVYRFGSQASTLLPGLEEFANQLRTLADAAGCAYGSGFPQDERSREGVRHCGYMAPSR